MELSPAITEYIIVHYWKCQRRMEHAQKYVVCREVRKTQKNEVTAQSDGAHYQRLPKTTGSAQHANSLRKLKFQPKKPAELNWEMRKRKTGQTYSKLYKSRTLTANLPKSGTRLSGTKGRRSRKEEWNPGKNFFVRLSKSFWLQKATSYVKLHPVKLDDDRKILQSLAGCYYH